MKKKVVVFHLFNDFSGSPHVLSLVIKGLVDRGYKIDLFTSTGRNGFLSNLEGVKYHNIFYRVTKNKVVTSILFINVQLTIFFATFRYLFNKNIVFYLNTIYPFGAAFGATITGKKIIYHVHEDPVKRNIISNFALLILNRLACRAIYVSNYLLKNSGLKEDKKVLVYNSLSPEFVLRAKQLANFNLPYNILMVCSLRTYKGIFIFCEIASELPQFEFTLVLNCTDKEAKSFFKRIALSQNLKVFSSRTDLDTFYSRANLLINLSITNLWIETFGLTTLEAMSYGLPVIVPPIGGITELVEDGIQGYLIDSRDTSLIKSKISQILSDKILYSKLSCNARQRSEWFTYESMIHGVETVINLV